MPASGKRKKSSSFEGVQKPHRGASRLESTNEAPSVPISSEASVVGGLQGDYRITGTEQSGDDDDLGLCEEFIIPAEKGKIISCRLYHSNSPTSTSTKRLLIFTHGAGGGIDTLATKLFAEGYAATSMEILCFQGSMNLKNRAKCFGIVLEYCQKKFPRHQLAVGGQSMGARAAVILAAERKDVKKIVAVSYPLVNNKGEVRDEILINLGADKSVYFLTGEKDSMSNLQDLEDLRKRMAASTDVLIARGADHGWSISGKVQQKDKTVASMRKSGGAMAAAWVRADKVNGQGTSFLDWTSGQPMEEVYGKHDLRVDDQSDMQTSTMMVDDKGHDRAQTGDKSADTMNKKKERRSDGNNGARDGGKANKKKRGSTLQKKEGESDRGTDTLTPRRSSRLKP